MNPNVFFYDALAAEYEQYYSAIDAVETVRQWLTLLDAEQLIATSEMRRLQPPRLLDLGCGPGRHLHAWQAANFNVTGLDASPSMLRLASKRCAGLGTDISLYCADVRDGTSLDPLGARFDIVVAHFNFLNLFSMDELPSVFAAVAGMLRHGGHWMSDITSKAIRSSDILQESFGTWSRKTFYPSANTVRVEWQRGNLILGEQYWLYRPDELRDVATSAGLSWRIVHDWNPDNPSQPWGTDAASSRQLIVVSK